MFFSFEGLKRLFLRALAIFAMFPLMVWGAGELLYHRLPVVEHTAWAWWFDIALMFVIVLTFRIRAGGTHPLTRAVAMLFGFIALAAGMGIYSKLVPVWTFSESLWFLAATACACAAGWFAGSALWGRRWLFQDQPQPDSNHLD